MISQMERSRLELDSVGRCALRERTVNGKRGIIIFRERVTLTFLSAERFDCIL